MSDLVSNKQTVETTKEKEYKKFINFGKLSLIEPSLLVNDDNFIDEIKKDLKNKFVDSDEYIIDTFFDEKQGKVISREEKLVFTRLNSNDKHFFGTFSRISNNKDVLTDIMDNRSNEKIDPESIYFEHNTLFYIDFSLKAISFIKTNHIKNVYPFLEIFLNNNNILNVKLFPLIKTEAEIKDSIITELTISCANVNTFEENFVEMKNLENLGCKIKDYKLSVTLEEIKPHFSDTILCFRNKHKNNLKKMSISTLNEDIDLITNTFTKSIPIKLNNNYEQDYSTIENTLKLELFNAIQR